MQSRSMIVRSIVVAASLACWQAAVPSTPVSAQDASEAAAARKPKPLKPRPVRPKPAKLEVPPHPIPGYFIFKLAEGTHVRLRNQKLVADLDHLTAAEEALLRRNKLSHAAVETQLATVNQLFQQAHGFLVSRLLETPEDELAIDQTTGQLNIGVELADLNLYYQVLYKDPKVPAELVLQDAMLLNGLGIVELVEFEPIQVDTAADLPPTTPDVSATSPGQGYLGAAPAGIDSTFARTLVGGDGRGVRIIDVERGWHLDHEDLPSADDYVCALGALDAPGDHGTAALGVIGAASNSYGVTGIASGAVLGVSSTSGSIVSAAIARARSSLRAGDVLLIEVGFEARPRGGLPCSNGNCEQYGMVPVEWASSVQDVIRAATANGVVVVEPAGNGGMNLDDPGYFGVFARGANESGAIMVGAGVPHTRVPEPWTNVGRRVDVQGWGEGVMTLGYGDIRFNGGDVRQFYTPDFGGTSSAAPIVAGAAAAIQGFLFASPAGPLTPAQMQALLVATGTPQGAGRGHIGPLPDLRAAVTALRLHPVMRAVWPVFPGPPLVSSPAVGFHRNDDLELFGIGRDGALYHAGRRPWERIGAGPLTFGGRASVVRNRDGRLEVFARTRDGAIGHAWQTAPNGGFTDWFTFGGSWEPGLEAVANADGRLEVFVKSNDGQVWHLSQVVAGGLLWSPFTSLGGTAAGTVATVADEAGRLHLFARFTDGHLHHISQRTPGGTWSAWETISLRVTGDPQAILGPPGGGTRRILVLARIDNRIGYSEASASGAFSPLLPIGSGGMPARFTTVAAAVTHFQMSEDVLVRNVEVLVRSSDGAIRRATRAGGIWSAWTNLGGNAASDPEVGIGDVNDIVGVFSTAPDGSIITLGLPH